MAALVLITLGLAPHFAACSRHDSAEEPHAGADRRPNVLFILADTLRADRVRPTMGSGPMPFLSTLASESVFYDRAYAPAPWTLPTIVSLFTAQYPTEHGVGRQWFWSRMPASAKTLAGVLGSNGYTTVALSAHAGINDHNVGRGFTRFDVIRENDEPGVNAERVNAAAFDWLGGQPASDAPWFLYLHYLDMHSPYHPHPGLTSERGPGIGRDDSLLGFRVGAGALVRTESERREVWNYTDFEVARMRELYDGEARYLDHQLAELFVGLQRRGALENTIVVLTADHGEEFGEHGVFGHGVSLYEAAVRVPLIIRLPNRHSARVREPVQIAGLGPTLLRELDIAAPAAFHIPPFRLREAGATGEPVYMELPRNDVLQLRLHGRAVVGDAAKLVLTNDGEPVLYDLVSDPGEQRPTKSLLQARELAAALTRIRGRLGNSTEAEPIDLEPATIERLRHLGYID